MLSKPLLCIWALLVAAVFAQVSTKSYVTCITKKGATSTPIVKTTSKVLTLPFYAYKTVVSTPSTTTTPAAVTSVIPYTTTTTTTTTLVAVTGTITATLTSTSTSTSIVTELTTTTFSTDTTSTVPTAGTTTIAASAGFVPVESTLPNSRKKREAKAEPAEALEVRQAVALRLTTSLKNGQVVQDKKVYPQAVTCAGIVAVISTSTRTKTATTTAIVTGVAATSFSTSTVTDTATSTVTPAAATATETVITEVSTTITTTTTSTVSETVTNTVIVSVPTATTYAACADNNIASTIGPNIITDVETMYPSDTEAASPYDCFVLCITLQAVLGRSISLEFANCLFLQVP